MNKRIKRSSWIAAVLWAVGASASWAQHEHHGLGRGKQPAEAVLEVRDDPAGGVLTVRIGPLDLPARSNHSLVAQSPALFLSVPFGGWFLAYHPRLADETGRTLPGRLLHHVAFWHTARRDFLCPNKWEHLFGAGGEMNDWPAVAGYGYRVGRGDRIRIDTMFHNPTGSGHRAVYLEVKIEYRRDGPDGRPLRNFYPAWFDVQECRNSGYDLKPGENVATGELRLRYGGTLLGVGGHLHDFGRRLDLVNATRGEPIATLDAKLDGNGRLLSVPAVRFADEGGYRLGEGDTLRVTAIYDNPTGKTLPEGAMGIVVGYFVPDDDRQMADLTREER
jgi:hypothetical protein